MSAPRVLWVATKAPWPPVDGGRLLLWTTLEALARRGVRTTLVAPDLGGAEPEDLERLAEVCEPVLVPTRLGPRPVDGLRSLVRSLPWSLVRHDHPRITERVGALLAEERFDLVQVEQVQALAQVRAAVDANGRGIPVVLRAQNVESDLWRSLGGRSTTPFWLRPWLRRQANLFAAAEGRAVAWVDATAALTRQDAERLAELAGPDQRSPVRVVPAPCAGELPAGKALEGDPAIVLFGSAGWAPNAEGAAYFLRHVWPVVAGRLPGARLHVFGGASRPEHGGGEKRVHLHPAPADSADALAAGSILAVPLFVASGVRMKILEAWARGVPVVATTTAARGLDATQDEELLVVDDSAGSEAFAAALVEASDAERSARLVEAGRARLREVYDADRVVDALLALWLEVQTKARAESLEP